MGYMSKELGGFGKRVGLLTTAGLFLAGCRAVEGRVPQQELDEGLSKPVAGEVDPTVEALVEEMGSTIEAELESVEPTVTSTPEPSPTPYVVESPVPESVNSGVLPLTPPEYKASGGAFSEAAQAPAKEAYYRSLYEMYKLAHGPTYFYDEGDLSAQEVFEEEMRIFATEQKLRIFQLESPDKTQVISFPVKDNGNNTWSMWWFTTEAGAFSARPDIPSTNDSTWTEIRVDGQIGGNWGEDGNFYVFQLNQNGEAVAWFSPAESVTNNLMWKEILATKPEVEQPVVSNELLELAAMYPLVEDWKDADQCQIPWELVKEGIPGKIAKLEGQPFPETAYNTGTFFISDDRGRGISNLSWGWAINGRFPEDEDYRTNSETRPYRWVGFFSVKDENGYDYVGGVQQWLNPSGKISYLTYVVLEEAVEYWQAMAIGSPIVNDTKIKEKRDYQYYYEAVGNVETQGLLGLWQKFGEIPDELESTVLYGYASTIEYYLPIAP